MRNKFLLTMAVAIVMAAVSFTSMAQTAVTVTETMYILPVKGKADQFEAAIKAHNTKFHPEGPYAAHLRTVDYGAKVGWYVWIMGPTTYASIDARPDKGEHDADWNKNVEPLIAEYGATDLWESDLENSFGRDIMLKSGHYDVWAVDVKRGQMTKFNEIVAKVKKTYETMGDRAFLVYRNPVHTADGADVALLFSYSSLADWSADWKVKETYEKLNGADSWQKMLDTWSEVVVDYNEELRSFVK